MEKDRQEENFPVVKDEGSNDSDPNNEDLSSHDEQININSNNSQFYESSDSKIDYAVKIDDNDTLSDIDDIKTDTASADSEDSALGSLPPDSGTNDGEEEAQDRSDGSDLGFGPESSDNAELPNFNLSLPCTSGLSKTKTFYSNNDNSHTSNIISSNSHNIKTEKPQKSNLKRKNEENYEGTLQAKRSKHSIQFDNVTVFYFPRAQGFTCVPSQGGSTLGMEWEHTHSQKFTLAEHALEQRRLHRQLLQQIKNERHNSQGVSMSSSDESDTEEETSDMSESELDLDSYYFLQPVPTRQRRALLRAAGVRKIEAYEKDECKDIRTSREFCGCACKGACNPENCSCSLAGIKCQVDRLNFPCGCTRDGCCNPTGRIEFNPIRVRTHFINTLMRIGLEKKNEEHQEAAKRQWAEAHSSSSTNCLNNSYERERCLSHEDGLLRDVNLTPRVEVETCVNSGSFNNVHCALTNVKDDSTFAYRSNYSSHMCLTDNNLGHFKNTNNHHHTPYASNILQGKGPPYAATTAMPFNTVPSNLQNFSCEINYAYEQHSEAHHFKGLPSFSATTFEEFAHSSQMSMYNHYGHLYMPDYMHKSSMSATGHNTVPYHGMAHNHYEVYKNNMEYINMDGKNESQYTTLTTSYQNSNKLQTLENDENWFSHNTLMNLDHCVDHTTQDSQEVPPAPIETPVESEPTDTTENFGELIKKTMVESVIV